ncbi:hypothetical protein ACF5W4_07480 [Bacillota bacterium Lsc_1132]
MAYYEKEEQETVVVFEPAANLWDIYTSVPKHIKRFKNDYIASVFHEEKDNVKAGVKIYFLAGLFF